jgi:hypothetical protein
VKIWLFLVLTVVAFVALLSSGSRHAEAAGATLDLPHATCAGGSTATVTFSWTPTNPGLQWLDLTLADNGFAPGTFIGVGPLEAGTSSFAWSGLLPGLPHFWRVHTLTDAGWQASETGAFVPCGNPVLLPTAITCGLLGTATIDFRWVPIADAAAVQWVDLTLDSTYPPGGFLSAGPLSAATTVYRWTGVRANLPHQFRVNALGGDGGWHTSTSDGLYPRCDVINAVNVRSAPPGLHYHFFDGVADEQLIRTAIDAARSFARSNLGASADTVVIFVSHDVEDIISAGQYWLPGSPPDEGWRSTRIGAAAYRVIFINTGPPGRWANTANPAPIAAHEYFHAVQYELMGSNFASQNTPSGVPLLGPIWLVEGSAHYLAYLLEDQLQRLDYARYHSELANVLSGLPYDLASMETRAGFASSEGAGYLLGTLAVELLSKPRGLASLATYYQAIGQRLDWRQAFTQAFGIDIEAFYQLFREYAANGFQ